MWKHLLFCSRLRYFVLENKDVSVPAKSKEEHKSWHFFSEWPLLKSKWRIVIEHCRWISLLALSLKILTHVCKQIRQSIYFFPLSKSLLLLFFVWSVSKWNKRKSSFLLMSKFYILSLHWEPSKALPPLIYILSCFSLLLMTIFFDSHLTDLEVWLIKVHMQIAS